MRSIWFCKKCPRFGFGIVGMSIDLETLPKIKATFAGTFAFEILKIFNPFKHDTWIVKFGGTFIAPATFEFFMELLKPVSNAMGIPGLNFRYLKIAIGISPTSPVLLKSLEVAFSGDLGPIKGLVIAGKLDIVMITNNYFYFGVEALSLSKIIGGCIGKTISGWPSFLDPQIDKTSMYIAFSHQRVTVKPGVTIDLVPGFMMNTGIKFLGFIVKINAGLLLKGGIPTLFVKEFRLDMRPLFAKIQALIDKIAASVSAALRWKALRVALSFMGKALLSFFPLRFLQCQILKLTQRTSRTSNCQQSHLASISWELQLISKSKVGVSCPV
jgi:hypothetical protein